MSDALIPYVVIVIVDTEKEANINYFVNFQYEVSSLILSYGGEMVSASMTNNSTNGINDLTYRPNNSTDRPNNSAGRLKVLLLFLALI
jgi:hypothetical protein